jgi:hypothetical protein
MGIALQQTGRGEMKNDITKVQIWGLWIRGISIAQMEERLNVKINLWPGSLSTLHQDIYDGKFDIVPL